MDVIDARSAAARPVSYGSHLDVISRDVDWNAVRADLEPLAPFIDGTSPLTLFRILLAGRIADAEDDVLAELVADRLSLRRFCGLAPEEPAPDAAAIRRFRSLLAASGSHLLLEQIVSRWQSAPLISVVSPVYRGHDIVEELVRRVTAELEAITSAFEIILVDDGSPDRSWEKIEAACTADPRVKGIRLSRNFGQHFAITAGLDHARGKWVVVMDSDLQDDPRYIRDLYAKATEGFDVVYAAKEQREHGMWKNFFAHAFNIVFNWLASGQTANTRIGAFSILSAHAVQGFRQVRETHRHYIGVLRWLGLPTAEVPVRHQPRFRGRSTYTPRKLIRHAIVGLTSQTDRLLYLALAASALFLCASIAAALYLVVMYYLQGFQEGWTSIVVLILLSTSAILFSIGVVGVYLGKTFDQVKERPLYLTHKKVNL